VSVNTVVSLKTSSKRDQRHADRRPFLRLPGFCILCSLAELEQTSPPHPDPVAMTKWCSCPGSPVGLRFWEIATVIVARRLSSGAATCLRSPTSTGLSGGPPHPPNLQEVPVRQPCHECTFPCSDDVDRINRVEMASQGWSGLDSLGFSARPGSRPASHEQILDQFRSFAGISHSSSTTPFSAPCRNGHSDLHERSTRKAPALLPRAAAASRPRFRDGALKPSMSAGSLRPVPRHGRAIQESVLWASGRTNLAGGVASPNALLAGAGTPN